MLFANILLNLGSYICSEMNIEEDDETKAFIGFTVINYIYENLPKNEEKSN